MICTRPTAHAYPLRRASCADLRSSPASYSARGGQTACGKCRSLQALKGYAGWDELTSGIDVNGHQVAESDVCPGTSSARDGEPCRTADSSSARSSQFTPGHQCPRVTVSQTTPSLTPNPLTNAKYGYHASVLG